MTMHPRSKLALLDAVLLSALAFGVALSPDSRAASGVYEIDGVQVRRGAALATRGAFGGLEVSKSDPQVARALAGLLEARALLPAALRAPVVLLLDPVAVSFGPSPTGIQARREGGSIVLHDATCADADRTVWLHELLHLATAGGRPRGPVGARLMAAVDEGVADFGAAAFAGATAVGSLSSGEVRDLAAPPVVGESEWAYLALPSAPWRAHRAGWALAAALMRESASAEFASDVVSSLANPAPFVTGDTPRAVLGEWISRCPSRSRHLLRRAVARWVPPELMETEPT
jgi:hypothetical protein